MLQIGFSKGDKSAKPFQWPFWFPLFEGMVLAVSYLRTPAVGKKDALHPPPIAWISRTLADMRRPRILAAVSSLFKRAVWAVRTFRYATVPALY